jgi:hypothetical protein
MRVVTIREDHSNDYSAQDKRPRSLWLDNLLDLTERSNSFTANSILIVVVVSTSLIFSMLLALLLHPLMGLPSQAGHFKLVLVISFIVPLIVGVPAVLFADALVRPMNLVKNTQVLCYRFREIAITGRHKCSLTTLPAPSFNKRNDLGIIREGFYLHVRCCRQVTFQRSTATR